MNEVLKCPKCGKTISEREAKYCPHCAEPLGKLRQQRIKAALWWGIASTLIGVAIMASVQPHVDYRLGPFGGASIELWFAGALSLLVGIGFIVYSYNLQKHEAELARRAICGFEDKKDEPSEPESDFAKLFKEEKKKVLTHE
jgi:predicted nucleic acid-binding Zn ribbon protein